MDEWLEFVISLWAYFQRNSSGISVVLSTLGFGVTWWQLARTRKVAAAARDAAKLALDSVGRADTLSDIATVQSGFHEVQVALRGGRYETALLRSQHLREILAKVRTRNGFEDEKRQIRMQKIVTDLRKLQDVMEGILAEPEKGESFSATAANKILGNAAAELATWIEQLRYVSGGRNDP